MRERWFCPFCDWAVTRDLVGEAMERARQFPAPPAVLLLQQVVTVDRIIRAHLDSEHVGMACAVPGYGE